MAETAPEGGKESLSSTIEKIGTKAFDPSRDEASRAQGHEEFGALISRAATFPLISALNTLIKPDRVPRWLRVPLMDILTLVPQRPDGVRATLEFVFSVHPSSTIKMSEASDPQKQGANITMEALKMASNLLAVPPIGVSPEQWFPGISPQVLGLLDGTAGPDLAKVASYIIGFGVLGRKQFGAPGTPGWKAFAESMVGGIDPTQASRIPTEEPTGEIVDLTRPVVIVQPQELSAALQRLTTLLNSHPNPGLTRRLLTPITPALWELYSWPAPDDDMRQRYCHKAKALLDISLRISASAQNLHELLESLLLSSDRRRSRFPWKYEKADDAGIRAVRARTDAPAGLDSLDWGALESKTDAFAELLQSLDADAPISTLFLNLLKKSMPRSSDDDVDNTEVKISIKREEEEDGGPDPQSQLVEAKVLQKMMDRMPDRLLADPRHILELVGKILGDSAASAAGTDESTPVALSLLNLVATAPNFQKANVAAHVLASITASLEAIGEARRDPDTSRTARNLSLLLEYRDSLTGPAEQQASTSSTPQQQQKAAEDRKTYQLALQYITQPDSPPPVRSEGLGLLSQLIRADSPVLDVPATQVLLCSLLSGDDDDYTAAGATRLLAQLADRHPNTTAAEVLDAYCDRDERLATDARLRLGEALLAVVQRRGAAFFAGDHAARVADGLLGVAGRRSRRPRTLARQDREARAEERKRAAARANNNYHEEDEDEDDEVLRQQLLDIDDDDGGSSSSSKRTLDDQRARNALLARIVSGWQSRRGAEDLRVRASALSILGAAVELAGGAGLGPARVEAVLDLALDVLELEDRGPEAGILRRAAAIAVLSFLRAVDAGDSGGGSRSSSSSNPLALSAPARARIARVLAYVAGTDIDGLAQQHARDALESLENLQMLQLAPRGAGGAGGFGGLSVVGANRPALPALRQSSGSGSTAVRPKIEEIE